jgi:hypothetical protein
VHFSINGDFDPVEVSEATGLSPFRVWRKGAPIARGRKVAPDDFWDYRIGPVEDSDFDRHLRSVVGAIFPHASYLTNLRSKRAVTYTVTMSAWVAEHLLSFAPIAFIETQVLAQISSLGASLQFDINLFGTDEAQPD